MPHPRDDLVACVRCRATLADLLTALQEAVEQTHGTRLQPVLAYDLEVLARLVRRKIEAETTSPPG